MSGSMIGKASCQFGSEGILNSWTRKANRLSLLIYEQDAAAFQKCQRRRFISLRDGGELLVLARFPPGF
jgi:hypothetical protein